MALRSGLVLHLDLLTALCTEMMIAELLLRLSFYGERIANMNRMVCALNAGKWIGTSLCLAFDARQIAVHLTLMVVRVSDRAYGADNVDWTDVHLVQLIQIFHLIQLVDLLTEFV